MVAPYVNNVLPNTMLTPPADQVHSQATVVVHYVAQINYFLLAVQLHWTRLSRCQCYRFDSRLTFIHPLTLTHASPSLARPQLYVHVSGDYLALISNASLNMTTRVNFAGQSHAYWRHKPCWPNGCRYPLPPECQTAGGRPPAARCPSCLALSGIC